MAEDTPLSLEDYEAIADAVQETERGRWFLAEYARRNRAADTAAVLEALSGLERRLSLHHAAPPRVAGLVREALDCALLARAAPPDEASQRFDALERTLRLAAAELGAPPPEPALLVVSEEILIEPPAASPAPLALAPPLPDGDVADAPEPAEAGLTADADDAQESDAEPEALAAPIAAPPIAIEEPEPESEPAPAISLFEARPLLLDSLSEAEKAILFA